MADLVGEKFGNFRLVRLLGKGGFADVYLGQHIHLDSYVAVKVLFARLLESEQKEFLHEARLIALLEHPSIVHILDCGVEHDTAFLVMNYAPHGTLRQRHPRGTRVDMADILSYSRQVTSALHYAHERRIIHRDVKPENMLLGSRQEVLLSDFGIAMISSSSTSQSTHDAAGTIPYMAPEQIMGKPRLASDQYALGIVIYEWLCGTRPFKGSFSELCAQHLYAPPPSLKGINPTISSSVEAVVMKALAKQPEHRFKGIQDFMTALEGASSSDRKSFSVPIVAPYPEEASTDPTAPVGSEGMIPTVVKPLPGVPYVSAPEKSDSVYSPVTPLPLYDGESTGDSGVFNTQASTRLNKTLYEPVSGTVPSSFPTTSHKQNLGHKLRFILPTLLLILALIIGSLVFALQHLQNTGDSVAHTMLSPVSTTTSGVLTQNGSPTNRVSLTATAQIGSTGQTTTTPTIAITPGLTPGISPTIQATTPVPIPTTPTSQPTPPTPTVAQVPPSIVLSPTSRINNFTNCTWDTHGGVGQDISCPYVLSNPANASGILSWSVSSNNPNVVFSKSNGTLTPGSTVTISAFDSSSCPITDIFTFQGNANAVQATMICTAIYTSPAAMSFDNTSCVHNGNWTCSILVQAPTQNSQNTPWVVTLQTSDPKITFSPSQGTLSPGGSVSVYITIQGSDCPGSNVFLFDVPNTLPVAPNYLQWSC